MADPLEQALAELAIRTGRHGIPIVIGGGYGLVLRRRQIREQQLRTIRNVPEARSTEDLDLFLTADLITDADRIATFRSILEELGYMAVPGAEYYQFARAVLVGRSMRKIKIDFLAPLPLDPDQRSLLKHDARRVRPRAVTGFHAHVAPEACGIGERTIPMELEGGSIVQIVHPFNYIVLKLFALRDRLDDPRKALGHYHAFDIYSIVAMFTEEQLSDVTYLRENFPDPDVLAEAGRITRLMFATTGSPGTHAVREHARQVGVLQAELDIDGFLVDLHGIVLGEQPRM